MRTKCPPELASGSGRLLDKHRPARDTFILTWGGRMPSQGQTPHPSERRSTPPTRSCALYRGCITVRGAGPKPVAKMGRQLRKDSAKCCVVCSMELAGHVLSTRPKVLSPLLVCWRYIRYQSDLPLVCRGFSAASVMRRKCPP